MDEARRSGAGLGSKPGRNQAPAGAIGELDALAVDKDPWRRIMDFRQYADGGKWGQRLHIGAKGHGNWQLTSERHNLLVLGPPRCNKTAGVIIPSTLAAPGPTVVVTTRRDIFRNTALTRRRLGRVWHYAPDGSPTPPGAIPLRWSPITASAKWDSAVALAAAMTKVSDTGKGMESGSFWEAATRRLLAPLLHAAALGNKDMMWVLRGVNGRDEKVLAEVEVILEDAFSPETDLALNDYRPLRQMEGRTADNIWATAATALEVYKLSGAINTTRDPNFDSKEFVAGDPQAWNTDRWQPDHQQLADMGVLPTDGYRPVGIYDTVYIDARDANQELVAPLVVGLLNEIRGAARDRHEEDRDYGIYSRPPVTFVLDELYGMAPMPDLPKLLSSCTGDNLYVVGVLHDLAQARDKWGTHGDSFPTVFGSLAVFRGIGDKQTLELLSTFAGREWVRYETSSNQESHKRGEWSQTRNEHHQEVARLEPGAIHNGHPRSPDLMLVFGIDDCVASPPPFRYVAPTPYYLGPPWTQLLVSTVEHFADTPDVDDRHDLPTPELDMHGPENLYRLGGEHLHERFVTARDTLRRRRAEAQTVSIEQYRRAAIETGNVDEHTSELEAEPQARRSSGRHSRSGE